MRTYVLPDGAFPPEQESYAQILGIHAALLPTGKILFFGGDQHDPGRNHLKMWGEVRLFDCDTLTIAKAAPAPEVGDLFCCGHAFLPDGRLLVAGGVDEFETVVTEPGEVDQLGHEQHPRGTRYTNIYDGVTNTWRPAGPMALEPKTTQGGGRWYPTLCTLGSGRVVALSGHPLDTDSRHLNTTVETFALSAPSGYWSDEGELPSKYGTPRYREEFTYYPRVHLLPDGRLFFASPIFKTNWAWNTATLSWKEVAQWTGENDSTGNDVLRRDWSGSVLLPLLPSDGYRPRVLVTGSSQPIVIDLSVSKPDWTPTGLRSLTFGPPGGGPPSPSPRRMNGNLVLLPTGEVVACGGECDYGDDSTAVLELELYRPATNTWVTLPKQANTHVPRGYHSVALLMPDGRVWMAGSNKNCDYSFHMKAHGVPKDAQEYWDPEHKDPVDNRELRIEIFEPWYFGRTDRPNVNVLKNAVSVGSTFPLTSDQASSIAQVVALRAGSCTHAFNPDQRLVGLTFTRSGKTLTVIVPDNENLLPPGPYLVFVLANVADDVCGMLEVPSLGHFIRIDNSKDVKEFKPEWDLFKPTASEGIVVKGAPEGDPLLPPYGGELIFLLRLLAERVDNIERRAAGTGRHFIPSEARPQTNTVIRPQAPAPQPTPEGLFGGPEMQVTATSPMPVLDEMSTHGGAPLPPAHETSSDVME